MTLRKKIPSAHLLFTFEAAAETLSFTKAGAILNVTQPAISKNIAALETHLGTKLFHRHKSGLALTENGSILFRAVQSSFTILENSIDQITKVPQPNNTLTFSISTAFAAHWLIPQMNDFRSTFPHLILNFQLVGGEASGPIAPCDLGVRLETEIYSKDLARSVCPEWIVAVASPEYIKRNGTLDVPKLGGSHSLVKLDQPRISWQQFLDDTDQSLEVSLPELRVPDYSVVLQSALNGRGVALGFITSCGYLLQEGLLELALPISLKTGKDYCIVTSVTSSNHDVVDQVSQWLDDKFQDSLSFCTDNIVDVKQL
ncbi:MAG: LysR family transcriptional regulator [Rhizobiaceae bacterium]